MGNYNVHVESARADFDRAIQLDRKNPWAWLGKGDVQTWLQRVDDAAASYEQTLTIDPLFDIARQRLISLYTAQAHRQAKQESWEQALATLNRLLDEPISASWIPEQKEAYLLRSIVFQQLNQSDQALSDLSTVIRVDPQNLDALANRAMIYRNRLQGSLARTDFEQACLLGSNPACEQLP